MTKALLVGVNEYCREELKDLSFAGADALAMYDYVGQLGFKDRELVVNPTAALLECHLKSLVDEAANDDVLLFYFSGHGVASGHNGQSLVCKGGDAVDTVGIRTLIERKRCHVVCIYDACRLPNSQVFLPRKPTVHASSKSVNAPEEAHGVTSKGFVAFLGSLWVFHSCWVDGMAHESKQHEHGLFTKAILEVFDEYRRIEKCFRFDDEFRTDVEERYRGLVEEIVSLQQVKLPESTASGKANYDKLSFVGGAVPSVTSVRLDVPEDSGHLKISEGVLKAGTRAGEVRELTLPGGEKLEMIWCPPGQFMMGRREPEWGSDNPKHRVNLTRGFWIGKYPVTKAQWVSVMGPSESHFMGQRVTIPVVNVTWNDCYLFCKKARLALRLPTEAEWEYALRAGDATPYCRDNVEYCDLEITNFRTNDWGIYYAQMNWWEWCADWYGQDWYSNSPTKDPKGPSSGTYRVFRGCCWYSTDERGRFAERGKQEPDYRNVKLGFRLVCCATTPEAIVP